MGEVRVKVKLSNALDEDRASQGEIKRAKVRSYVADCLVDTGAVRTVLPIAVVEKLGLRIHGHTLAEYADGRTDTVGLAGPFLISIDGRDAFEDALVLGDEVLIGQTVLEKLDLWVDCNKKRLVPNPAHPDQPVNKVK